MPNDASLPKKFIPIQLFPMRTKSRLCEIVDEARRLAEYDPVILTKIDSDRDMMALEKKRIRLRDREWEVRSGGNSLLDLMGDGGATDEVVLGEGRPRLPALLFLTFSMIRGWLGGAKESVVRTMLAESVSVAALCEEFGVVLPGASTIEENCNAISAETQEYILKAQLVMARGEGLDDYFDVAFDSTVVWSMSAFPTDSSVIAKLVSRIRHGFEILRTFDLEVSISMTTELKIEEVLRHAKEIALIGKGKDTVRKRKRLYKVLYTRSRAAIGYLTRALNRLLPKVAELQERPSIMDKIEGIILSMKEDLVDTERAIAASEERTQHGGKVDAVDKVLSVSDDSAAMIVKGGREPVLGYKPQIGRSATGLVTAFMIDEGNPTDSSQMVAIVKNHRTNTGVTPKTMSFDSGYASAKGFGECQSIEGVEKVSISGAKGRRLISEEMYDSLEYEELRNFRSTVESTIGHLKGSHRFGECRRSGLKSIRHELMEKILSFNLVKILRLRAIKAERANAA